MNPLNMRAFLLVFLALVAAVSSGPISLDDDTCATTCTEPSKFQYSVGKKYVFAYEADTVTALQGAADEHSSLHIRATAHISVLSPCEFILMLGDVTLEHSDPSDLSRRTISENSREFRRSLEAAPLKFSFQNGRIESVCADGKDASWVVNMKRGVLSAFQNTQEDFGSNHKGTETDVAGVCDAEYKVVKKSWGGKTLISKSKDLAACTDRHGHFSALQATPYKLSSDMRSMPLMSGSHTCEQTISSTGILERSECREEHIFRPFSNEKSGASTTTRQLLTFTSEAAQDNVRIGNTRRSTLLFEHEDTFSSERDDSEVNAVLREICELNDVRPETPRLYSRLVYAMRKVDARTLSKVHRQIKSGNVCERNNHMSKKFFHDAIPSVSTAATASLMRDLILAGEVSSEDADTWITSLAFVSQPSSDMIREVTPLLKTNNRKTYLSVSTLVHSYCRQREDCDYNDDVQQVLNTILGNLGYNCRDSDNEKLIMSLKALGNTGRAPQAMPVLTRCIANTELPMEVRVSAVEAFRRMPCENREELLKTLMNAEEDSELRIHSYLAIMQCPSESAIFQIRDMLTNEEVNQVGSFIWTHMTNLKETGDLFKQEIKAILNDEKLQKEFNLDARKFSRNYEGSVFFDSLNMGAKVDSNVIFSPKSFVPRSAMVNMTIDMFGKSVNFLEIGGRVEGAEDYLQKLFGPDGYFPAETREKRSISADEQLKEQNRADPKASAYVKMFGNEHHYWDLSDFHKVDKEDFNLLDLLIKLADNHEVEWSKSAMFLDSELSIPTILGMPLKLSVNGTATIDVKMGGKIDLRQIAAYPNSMDINGYVKPSGAIEISSVMGLDAFVAKTGLKMVSTLHSSSEVDGLIKLDESKSLQVKFNLPKDKIEILNVKTQFFIVHKDEDREQKMSAKQAVIGKCSGKTLESVLGLKLCADLSYPVSSNGPSFPMNGPIEGSITLNKVDSHQTYEFEAFVSSTKEKRDGKVAKVHQARLAFNTPGSKVDREIIAELMMDSADNKISGNLKTPWKQATLDGIVINRNELKSARLDMTMDKKPLMNLLAELQIDARPKATKYNPNVEVVVKGKPVLTLKGDTKYIAGEKLDADLTLDATFLSTPVILKGGVDADSFKNKARWNTDFIFNSPVINSKISGFTQRKNDVIASRMDFTYDYNGGKDHRFVLNSKFKDQGKGDKVIKYNINTAISSTEFPDKNVEIDADFSLNMKRLETNLDMRYGKDAKDESKRIIFNQELQFEGNMKDLKVDHVAKLKWKAMDLDMQNKLSHKHDRDSLKTQGTFSYTPNKEIVIDATLKKDLSEKIAINGDIILTIPGREMRLFNDIDQKTPDVFNHEMIMQWQKGGQVRTTSTYTRVPAEKRHEIRSEIYGPVGEPTVVSGSAILRLEDFSGKAQIEHRRSTYSTQLAYNYKMKPQQKSINANFDLAYPSRHVTAEGSFACDKTEHTLTIKTLWDADRDNSQKFVINGNIAGDLNAHQGQLKVIVPKRTITVSVDNKFENGEMNSRTAFSWAPQKTITVDASGSLTVTSYAQKVAGKIAFTSPFAPVEELMVNLNHRFNRRGLINQIDFTYAPGKTFSSDFDMKINNGPMDVDSKITISTPIDGFQKMKSALTWSLTPSTFTSHWDGSILDNEIVIDATGKSEGSSVEASAQMTTPFRAIRQASASWKHTVQGAQIQAETELTYNRQSIKAELLNTFQNTARNQQLQTRATLSTTFPAVRDAHIEATYQFNGQKFNGNFVVSHNEAEKFAITGTAQKMDDATAQITVRVQGVEEMSAEFNAKTAQTPKTGRLEMKWRQSKTLTLEGELTSASLRRFDGQFTISSTEFRPVTLKHQHQYRGINYFSLNQMIGCSMTGNIDHALVHQKNGDEFVTKYEVNFLRNKRVSIETKLQLEGEYKASMDLTTTFPEVPALSLSVNHRGYGSTFVNRVSVNSQIMRQPIAFTSSFDIRGAQSGAVDMKLNTPFTNMEDLGLTVTHSYNGQILECHSSIKMDARREITFDHKMDFTNGMTMNTAINTPFRSFRGMSADLEHSGPIRRFNNKASVAIQTGYGPIKYDSSLRFGGLRYINGQMTLSTPFRQVDNVAMNINHNFRGDMWSTNVDVTLPNIGKTEVESKINMNKADVTLRTPYTDDIIFSMSQNTIDNSWEGKTSLTYAASKTVEGMLKFEKTYNGVKASTKISAPCPHFQNIDAEFEHSGPWNNFNNKLTASIDRKSVTTDVSFKFDFQNLDANVNVNTPWTRKMAATVSHQQTDIRKFTSSASGKYGRNEININSNINLKYLSRMSVDVSLNTPFPAVNSASLNIEHNGMPTNFNNKVVFEMNGEQSMYQGTFKYNNGVSGNFKIDTPFATDFVTITFDCNGAKNNIEASYSGKKIVFQSTYDSSNGIRATADLNTPFTRPMSVNVNQAGMSVDAQASYGNKRTTFLAQARMEPFTAKIVFTSPFDAIERVEVTMSGQGDIGEFTTDFSFSHNNKNNFNMKTEFQSLNDISGKFEWTSTFKNVEAITLEFSHKGSSASFESSGMLSYAPNKKISTEIRLQTSPAIDGYFKINTPYQYLKAFEMNVDHAGSLLNFQSKGDVTYNNDKVIDAEVSLSSDRTTKGSLKLIAPYTDLSAEFNHKWRRNMESTGSVTLNGKTIKYAQSLNFGQNNMDYSFNLQTPFAQAKDMAVLVHHDGDATRFMNTVELIHEHYGQINTETTFEMEPLKAGFKIKTPSEWVKDLDMSFDYTKQPRGILSNAAFSLNNKEYKIAADLKTYPESTITIKTPFEAVRDLTLNVKSNNNPSNFEGAIVLTKNKQEYVSASANLNTIRKVEGAFKLNTVYPAVRSVEVSLRHEGNVQQFNNLIDVSYNGKKMFHGDSDFAISPMKGSFNIETPLKQARSLKAAFSHSGSSRQFRTHAEFTHNIKNQFAADIVFQTYPGVEATIQITTPFEKFETISLTVNHQGNLSAFQSKADLTISRDKYGAQAQFAVQPNVDGRFNVATPIRGYRNINGAIKFTGDVTEFETNAELSADQKTFDLDATFKAWPLKAKATLKTPFEDYEELSAEVEHKGVITRNFQSRAAVTYKKDQSFEMNAEFKNYGRMVASIGIKTPFLGYENIGAALKHRMGGNEIESSAEATFGRKSVSADMRVNPNDGAITFDTPIRGVKKIELTYNHQISRSELNANAQLKYGRNQAITYQVNAKYPSVNEFSGSVDINTPFYGYETMKMSVSHLNNGLVKCNMEMSLNNKVISGTFNLNTNRGIVSSVTINTPFRNFEEMTASLTHTGGWRRFQTRAEANVASQKLEISGDFDSVNDIIASFRVSCPCPYIGNSGAEFSFKGDKTNFKTNGKLYKDNKAITLDGNYASQNGIPTEMNFEITNPFTSKISLTGTNNYRRNGGFSSNVAFSWSDSQRIDIRAKGTLTGSISDLILNSDLVINTPFRRFYELALKTEHQHSSSGSLSTKIELEFNRQKLIDGEVQYGETSGNVVMRVPYPMSASVKSVGNINDMSSNMELNWDTTQRDSNIKMEVSHKLNGQQREFTIRTITARRTMSVVSSLTSNTYTFAHNAAFSWDEGRGKTVSYKINFNDRSRRYNHVYALETRVDTPIRSFEMTMNHQDDSATYTTDAALMWDAARDQSKKISMNNQYSKSGNVHNNELKITHPAMNKDLIIRNNFEMTEKVIFDGTMEVEYTNSPIKMSARLENQPEEYGAFNYTLNLAVSHPRSTIDIKSVAFVANSRRAMGSGLLINYQTAQRDNKMVALRAEINKIKKTFEAVIDTPMKKAEVSGDISSIQSGTAYNLAAKSEGKAVTGRLEVQPINNAFDLKTYYSPDNQANVMHITGHYVSPTSMKFEAYRMHNGDKVVESTLDVDLENGHLLKTSAFWRPEMLSEIKGQAYETSRMVKREASDLYNELSTSLYREARRKGQLFNAPDFTPFITYTQAEMKSFSEDAAEISRAFKQMYYRNEFFMRSIAQGAKDAYEAVASVTEAAAAVVKANMDKVIFQAKYYGFRVLAATNRFVQIMIDNIYVGVDFAHAQYMAGRQIAYAIGKELWAKAQAKWAIYGDEITAKLLAIAEKITIATKPVIEFTVETYNTCKKALNRARFLTARKYNELMDKLPIDYITKSFNKASNTLSRPIKDVSISVRDNVKGYVGDINTSLMKLIRQSSKRVSDAMDAINAKLTDFLANNDDNKYAHAFVQEVYKQGKALYEYLELEKNVRDLVRDGADMFIKTLRKNSLYLVDDYLNLEQDKLIKYNPRRGELEFQIWLPMELPSLQAVRIPDISVIREMASKTVEFVKGLIPQDFSPYDYYYSYKPADITNLIPPFNTYAMISGNQHFITWDKRYFEFAGSCSYTLARDFVDQTFEVLVNYEDQREVSRKSVSLRTEGKTVEITSKGLVTIDGNQVELPQTFGAVFISRDNDLVSIVSDKGFTLSCDAVNDACMLSISGWYYNKMAGLFGTYTNEKTDDFMTAQGSIAKSVDEFAKSWTVGRCRSIENRARVWESTNQVCEKLFNNQYSILRRCYKVVDPAPYLKMCTNDATDDVTNRGEERSACKAAAMYVMHCRKEGVSVRLPRGCVACDKPSYDQYMEGEELTAYAAEQSADVVFVIEEKPCNTQAVNKLDELAQNIDAALKLKGLSNNQFGLIGFGGADSKHDDEHSHTVSGKILGDVKSFKGAVDSLSFTTVGSNTDVLKALRKAAKYPFRAGVAKSVVLITCSECTEQAARYNEIEHNLKQRGIVLHVIMDHEFLIGSNIETPKTSYLFGIDKETAYTSRHVSDKDLAGDQELFQQIAEPTTMCAKLAQSTSGSLFDFNKMIAGRVRFQKHFLDVFSRRVAKSAEVPTCQVCECVSDSYGIGRSVCKPCDALANRLDERVLGYQVQPQQVYQKQPEFNLDFEEYKQ